MSTLTQGRPAFGGALLLFLLLLLFVIVRASLPPLAQPGPGDPPPAASASPMPPPPPEWRWGGQRGYEQCPGTAIQHILCRHGSSSKYNTSKFFTNSKVEIRQLVKEAMRKGKLYRTDSGWRIEHTFSRNIGKSNKGKLSDQIEILLSEAGEILTAYPK